MLDGDWPPFPGYDSSNDLLALRSSPWSPSGNPIQPLEDFSEHCFELDGYILAETTDQEYHVWHLFCRAPDGSLETVNGVFPTLDDDRALGFHWANEIISKLDRP